MVKEVINEVLSPQEKSSLLVVLQTQAAGVLLGEFFGANSTELPRDPVNSLLLIISASVYYMGTGLATLPSVGAVP